MNFQSQRKRRKRKNLAELIPSRTEPDKPPPIDYFIVEAARFTDVSSLRLSAPTPNVSVLPTLYTVFVYINRVTRRRSVTSHIYKLFDVRS